MIKASALYIAIVIAAVIAIFSASLITTAYFYRMEYQKSMRIHKLSDNLESGVVMLLADGGVKYDDILITDLFGKENDSISLKRERWGAFDMAAVTSFTLRDTLKMTFFTGILPRDTVVLYLSDEDRPISVSGDTRVVGDALLPKAGIKQAYVGRPYAGKKLLEGNIKNSNRKLPPLDNTIIRELEKWLNDTLHTERNVKDSVFNSFFEPVKVIRFPKSDPVVRKVYKGKIILLCDTVLTISADARLTDVMAFAPSIIVKENFRGNCQLFARDSIIAGKKVTFDYPSCIGILKDENSIEQPRIVLGESAEYSGIIFSWEKSRSDLQTMVSLGKSSLVKGEVYASGFIKMEPPLTVEGKVSCNRFVIKMPVTLYENYLIDITLNRPARSRYYLSSALFGTQGEREVLKWLE